MLAIRFDGPPGHRCGRFIEAELDGRSISLEWKQDGDDYMLVLPEPYAKAVTLEAQVKKLEELNDALRSESEKLRALWIDFLISQGVYGKYGVEIPESLSATLDIGLPLARRIAKALE